MKVIKHLEEQVKKTIGMIEYTIKEKDEICCGLFCEQLKDFLSMKLEITELQRLQEIDNKIS